MSNLFETLAMEAGIIQDTSPNSGEVKPISEIILEDSEQEQPLDVLKHARDAREIADDLDDLADRAEKLAEEDEGGVHGTISVESMHREYLTIMKANKLDFNAFSFEAAGTVDGQILGLRDDARRTALDLRNAAESMEAGVSRYKSKTAAAVHLFTNKDKGIRNAVLNLERSKAALAGASVLNEEGVSISWDGYFTFLKQKGANVTDLAGAMAVDKKYLEGIKTYLQEVLSNLRSIKTENDKLKLANENLVNTGKGKLGGKNDYPLMGSEGVGDFTLRTLPGSHKTVFGRLTQKDKLIIIGSATAAVMLPSVFLQNAAMITSGFWWQKSKDSSKEASGMSLDKLKELVNLTLDVAKLNDGSIDTLFNEIEAEFSRIKELNNKEAINAAKSEVSNCKAAIAILKHRVWYLVTKTATLAEKTIAKL